ncbi:polyprenyl synthetase family protein [Treponema primitia ZAS-2]|uniref:Polyprenyl synthetase family protein n=1 Tax=Treponema primitia (strain ATCC BAA-887 / DSM 12427 / ZAS-2) TaxID=545694 RepID=F5YJX4_TREPZ|nr:polyprenyl synthetase family protein [Treponema primitia]AEF86106.1 polyprenyl synthetase family protein [Treponema primitia ZAS-2]
MDSKYTPELEKIEAVLSAYLPENPGPAWIAGVFPGLPGTVSADLVKSLTLPGWDLLSRGGKRWRPLLTTLVCKSLGGGDAALVLTPLVEFPHNASLIHDDIEDNSDERRGKPAAHILYGTDTAINGGCFLYFLPLSCIDSWDAPMELKNRVYRLWGEYMRRLHLGQAMDISWHRDFASLPGLEEYELMCRLKTGCLAGLAAVLGVYGAAAGKGIRVEEIEPWSARLGDAAEKLGVGFQILDDVKNLSTGNPGKKRGDDIVEGKKSLPVLLYLHQHQGARDLVARCFTAARAAGVGAPEVEELIAELDRSGSLGEAKSRGLALIAGARETFAMEGAREGGQGLLELIDSIS